MGKRWDYDVPGEDIWSACLRVLKPGGHLLAFAGTRTQHRMAVKIEDAGFEIRDMIAWVYGSGFPKSLDVSKAIDKAAGASREVVGVKHADTYPNGPGGNTFTVGSGPDGTRIGPQPLTAPATAAAAQWAGWGTALKPAMEPITVARKPLVGTVAENVLQHGTGAINVDGCRVGTSKPPATNAPFNSWRNLEGRSDRQNPQQTYDLNVGRWPANLIHDGSDEVVAGFPVTTQNGFRANPSTKRDQHKNNAYGKFADVFTVGERGYTDTGSAARFFYCAKASKADRDEGCEGNNHPTVKPTELMRYLVRLVTPPGGTVLDPFMGSGSTGKAAVLEGFGFIGIERELEYIEIARARIAHALQSNKQQTLLL